MSICKLIDGETISIDNHNAGQEIGLEDKALHLHKRYNHKSRKGGYVEEKFPLYGGEMEIKETKGIHAKSIEKERKKAFSNQTIRKEFIDSMWKLLSELATKGNITPENLSEEKIESLKKDISEILKRVVRYFGVDPEQKPEIVKPSADYLAKNPNLFTELLFQYIPESALYTCDVYRRVYVKVNLNKASIELSQARYMLENQQLLK